MLTELLLVVAIGAGIGAHERQRRLRRRAERAGALLSAGLGTISGVCYRYVDGRAIRIDGRGDDPVWPLVLDDLLRLAPTVEAAVRAAFASLALTGKGETLQMTLEDGSRRAIELTLHRVTSTDQRLSFDLVWVTDISDRAAALAEGAERAAERDRLAAALDTIPVPVWWRDRELAITNGNARFRQLPALATFSRPLADSAAATGTPQSAAGMIGGETGGPFEVTEIPIPGGSTVGFARDRSEIEQARNEITRLGVAHREVLETVTTAIAIFGPDARLLFYNTAYGRLWQLDPDFLDTEPALPEVLDLLREQRVLPEYADFRKFKAEQAALFSDLRAPREELLHLPDDRTLRQVVSRHPFGGLTFTYENVTDRLALERSYNTLSEVQRATLDNLSEGLVVFGSDGRLTLWNPAFAEMWLLQPHDLANRPHISTLVERMRPFYAEEAWDKTKAEIIDRVISYTSYASTLDRRDGLVLEINTIPLPDGNVLLSYLDVSDSARVRKALRDRNEALETAGRLKSEFIANVSYELRTPLNAIIGFADILSNQYFGPLNDRQLEYSRGIFESSQRLMSLINDILDIASIEAGELTLDRSPVDVHAMLASVLTLTRERAKHLQLNLAFDCPHDIGVVTLDEARIRQALFNLLSNAIKFTPTGGTITLGARRIGPEVALSVSDTGIGIAAELQAKVFESFERGQTDGRQVGAGLGLTLVRSFIEMHGGRVELDSAVNGGTCVTCWLPAL
ncbi:two-component sensor histidine kinase [Aliidongia dinghuensis]|uniref:histidine kinase n=1 Tax=Aliidongia dinghuensis TaxID=1867774 RepID=A0A8J3E4P0_9PROT|nr:PAS domain-containing sensor histidine kinase [Aliidongia dinghuensis]GGF28713.1 two-component sensor histidine kinase [Aliidongia dinghuensis]